MSLTIKAIQNAASDDELLELLSAELQRLVPREALGNEASHLAALRGLPRGLRAMAATHRLGVSMAMDDLGWYFYNFGSPALCDEAISGLRELGATEAAEILAQALVMTGPHWEEIERLKTHGVPGNFAGWYAASGLQKELETSNRRLWKVCSQCGERGLMFYWLEYARKHPARVVANESAG